MTFRNQPWLAWALVFGLVFAAGILARAAPHFLEWLQRPSRPEITIPLQGDETPEQTLARVQAGKQIINAHEHLQELGDAQRILASMEEYGIAKTVIMGSSRFTLTLDPRVGFTGYDENNEAILEVAKAFPGRFEAWPTLSPLDPDKLAKIQDLLSRGATGVKLYIGHGYIIPSDGKYMFHPVAIDDPGMMPVYAYFEKQHVPVCLHVNPGPTTPGFAQEFITILERYPDLKVNAPHFILSSIKDSRLRELLDVFPNLYSDISFGHDDFLKAGLERISRDPTKFQDLFQRYPDRFMLGLDLVMTPHPEKTTPWYNVRVKAYLDMLTKAQYTTELLPGQTLSGLSISGRLLENILYRNYEAFMALRPEGTRPRRRIEWKRIGVDEIDRRPGQALPPPKKGKGVPSMNDVRDAIKGQGDL